MPRKSVVRLTDRPDMTLDVYHGRKTTIPQQLAAIESGIQFQHVLLYQPITNKKPSLKHLYC